MPERRATAAERAGTCKHCQRDVWKGGDGSLHHDRRAKDEAPPAGDGAPPPGDPQGDAPPPPDTPPRREHLLHRQLVGGRKAKE